MNNDIKVVVPNELLKEFEICGTMVNPINTTMGILMLAKDLVPKSKNITVRLYRIQKNQEENDSFSIYYELEAFTFNSYKQASQFINHFPKMSAAELLLLINPVPH